MAAHSTDKWQHIQQTLEGFALPAKCSKCKQAEIATFSKHDSEDRATSTTLCNKPLNIFQDIHIQEEQHYLTIKNSFDLISFVENIIDC